MQICNRNGFSLVEVLVASLIIILGVTGYVTLQTEYVLADRNLNLRSVATQLGQDKLQDLMFFQQLTTTTGIRSYNDISSNLGGDIPAGATQVQLSSNKGDTYYFDITWLVEDYYYVDSDFDALADTWVSIGDQLMPKLLPLYSDMKMVTVNILWVSIEGDPQKVSFSSNITPISQSNTYQVLKRDISANSQP